MQKTREKYITEKRMTPVVYFAGIDKNITPGARCGPVIRDVYLIECCIRGYGTIIINGTEHPITPRCCYFLFPGDTITHVTDDKLPREGYFAAVEGIEFASALKSAGITSESPFAPPEIFDEVYSHLETLYKMRDESDLGADLRRTSHLYAILGVLLRDRVESDKDAAVKKAIAFMETNYHSDISVSTLASEVGLERSYFSSLFKSQTGTSPHAYLTYLRIKKASSLMLDGAYSMAEIASAVGLDSQNFARIFKREVGVTPLEFKKKAQGASGK